MVLIAPVLPPDAGLIYSSNNVRLKIGNKIIGNGVIFISQTSLAWQPEHFPEGISISWKQVSVHGISNNPAKCIYFMLDHKIVWRGVYDENGERHGGRAAAVVANGNGGAMGDGHQQPDADEDEGNATDEEDEEPEEEQMTECWLLPEDLNTVDTMFQAMTDCQALHPDSADSISEESDFMDDDGQDDGDDGGNVRLGPAAAAADGDNDGAAAAQGGMRNLNLNDDRFADAD